MFKAKQITLNDWIDFISREEKKKRTIKTRTLYHLINDLFVSYLYPVKDNIEKI